MAGPYGTAAPARPIGKGKSCPVGCWQASGNGGYQPMLVTHRAVLGGVGPDGHLAVRVS